MKGEFWLTESFGNFPPVKNGSVNSDKKIFLDRDFFSRAGCNPPNNKVPIAPVHYYLPTRQCVWDAGLG